MRASDERAIRVVLVDGDASDPASPGAVGAALAGRGVELRTTTDLDEALRQAVRGDLDVLMLDLGGSEGGGLPRFEKASAYAPEVPIITLSEEDDPELALAVVQGGAQDHLVRRDLTPGLLLRAILYAVERHRLVSALRSLSVIDDLTGLYNRRGFEDLGEQHLRLSRRSGRGLTLVFCDLDRFKEINDTAGHAAGDRILRAVAGLLRSSFRRSDIVGRLGGDEFGVLALEVGGEDQRMLAERIQSRVEAFNAEGREPFTLSLSVGVARFDRDTGGTLADLMARADAAMYAQKRSRQAARGRSG